MNKAEVRGARTPKVRKGTGDLVRTSIRHRDRRREARNNNGSVLQAAIDEWADEMENGDIWKG